MSPPLTAQDLEAEARRVLSTEVFDFIAGGADDESTLRANLEAFRSLFLRPRRLVDVSSVDVSTTLLGSPVAAPLFVPPMASHRLVDPEGELASAAAAAEAGVGYVTSLAASTALEDVADAAGRPRFVQVYMYRDREVTADLIRRAEAAGYDGVCLTIDAPVFGQRYRDLRNRFRQPYDVPLSNLVKYGLAELPDSDDGSAIQAYVARTLDPSTTWADLDWVRAQGSGQVLLKGVMIAEDARRAVDAGVDAVIVSNHGGRQLGRLPGTIEVLEEVVEAVGGRLPVLVDGGFRGGADVAIALALGASAVGMGRPVLWALAAGGRALLADYLRALTGDLERTLALAGAATLGDLDRSFVGRRP